MLSTRNIRSLTTSAIGLGCMNLSHAYGSEVSAAAARSILERALELGITHFDTAALYGFGANEKLLGEVLTPFRPRFTLASKGGVFGRQTDTGIRRVIDGRPQSLRENCEASLRNLRVETIDLYYLHRWDKTVPIEESIGELGRLVAEGKIRHIGVSEVSGETLQRAHRVHPIAAVQSEYSVMTRNPEIRALDVCRDIGAVFVAFSPVARGFLSAEPLSVTGFEPKDIRRSMPRFEDTAYQENYRRLRPFREFAAALGVTPSQLGIAWLLHQGPNVLVIPGTSQVSHLEENVAADAIRLDGSSLARLNRLVHSFQPKGNRYSAATRAEVDSEEWPDGASL